MIPISMPFPNRSHDPVDAPGGGSPVATLIGIVGVVVGLLASCASESGGEGAANSYSEAGGDSVCSAGDCAATQPGEARREPAIPVIDPPPDGGPSGEPSGDGDGRGGGQGTADAGSSADSAEVAAMRPGKRPPATRRSGDETAGRPHSESAASARGGSTAADGGAAGDVPSDEDASAGASSADQTDDADQTDEVAEAGDDAADDSVAPGTPPDPIESPCESDADCPPLAGGCVQRLCLLGEDGATCQVTALTCACMPGYDASCADGDACTLEICNIAGFCQVAADVGFCDDGNMCTLDTCVASSCGHVSIDADACSDGSVCSLLEHCVAGFCKSDAPMDCDDSDPCTVDICDPQDGCKHLPSVASACA